MTSMRNMSALLGVAVLAAASSASAAIINVPADFSTVAAAITQANSNAGADTIRINVAGTYTNPGAMAPAADQDLTIEATVAGVILENNGSAGAVIAPAATTVGRTIHIAGPSSANRITLRKAGSGAQPCINSGGGPGVYSLENVTLDRTSSTNGTFYLANSSGTSFTLTNVNLTGGNTGAGNILNFSSTAASATVSLTNVDVSAISTAQSGNTNIAFSGSCVYTLTASNCTFESGTGANRTLWSGTAGSGSTLTFNSCSFKSDPSATTAFILPSGATITTTLNNPTFTGGAGSFLTKLTAGATVNINGTSAASKVSLNALLSGGTVRVARILNGTLNLTDVSGSTPSSAGSDWFDSGFEGGITGASALTFNRCDFQGGAGQYHMNTSAASSAAITITGLNSIWKGVGSTQRSILSFNSDFGGPASTMNLTHCTFFNPATSNDGLVNVDYPASDNPGSSAAGRGDVINANYCIFDGTGGLFCGAKLPGDRNVVKPGSVTGFVSDTSTNTGYVTTLGDVVNINSSGRLIGNSKAADLASPSTESTDVDGNARPQGTARDAGAHEVAFTVPVSISGIEIE